MAETDRLIDVELDEAGLATPTPEVAQERKVAIFDLLEENSFTLARDAAAGPYRLKLAVRERRLVFDVRTEADEPAAEFHLSLSPFRQIIKDYFQICESYFDAVKKLPASQIEDVDPRFDKIVRRATHPSPMLRFADGEAMALDLKKLRDALENQVTGIVTAPSMTMVAQPPRAEPVPSPEAPVPEAAPPPAPAPEVQVNIGTDWSLLRNLVIIVLLLAAIFGMYQAYQWRKDSNAEQQAEQQRRVQRQMLHRRQQVGQTRIDQNQQDHEQGNHQTEERQMELPVPRQRQQAKTDRRLQHRADQPDPESPLASD